MIQLRLSSDSATLRQCQHAASSHSIGVFIPSFSLRACLPNASLTALVASGTPSCPRMCTSTCPTASAENCERERGREETLGSKIDGTAWPHTQTGVRRSPNRWRSLARGSQPARARRRPLSRPCFPVWQGRRPQDPPHTGWQTPMTPLFGVCWLGWVPFGSVLLVIPIRRAAKALAPAHAAVPCSPWHWFAHLLQNIEPPDRSRSRGYCEEPSQSQPLAIKA